MTTLPAFLNPGSKPTAADQHVLSRDSYTPLLGLWLIDIALFLDWPRIPSLRPFLDTDFIALTGLHDIQKLVPDEHEEEDEIDMGALDEFIDTMLPKKGLGKSRPQRLARTPRDRKNALHGKLPALLDKRRKVLLRQVKNELSGELPLFQNIDRIGRQLNLDAAEQALLLFAACMSCFERFRGAIMPNNTEISNLSITRLVVRLTGQAEGALRHALRRDGVLLTSGLVKLEADDVNLEDKLVLVNELRGVMLDQLASDNELSRRVLHPASPAKLGLADFPHLSQDIDLIRAYLLGALSGKEKGGNILIYGPPGTGKTELAKAMAADLGFALYEIAYADENGEPIPGEQRLTSLNFCQRTLQGNGQAAILFDEVEDVLPGNFASSGLFSLFMPKDRDKAGKAWINRSLEENPVPTLWITNNANIDPAYLRRFDYNVALRIPPRPVRARIVRDHLGNYAPSQAELDNLADLDDLLPSQLERAARVARIAADPTLPAQAWQYVEMALTRSRALLGQARTNMKVRVQTGYRLEFLNADANIPAILDGLKRRPQASFCLYGAPGTGKSLLARHIADQLGKPLIVKRASDLLDKYVGETEQRIAAMFEQARMEDAVLVLDEADSFLSDRSGAKNAWEVTQVNELLTQLEAFDGLFFATTNLMDRLDAASVRRFSHKIRFGYLTSEQRWAMFAQEVARLGWVGDSGNTSDQVDELQPLMPAVRRLDNLTPGDFAAALRRLRLQAAQPNAHDLLAELEREVAAKRQGKGTLGFI